jgi:hypothetical protein
VRIELRVLPVELSRVLRATGFASALNATALPPDLGTEFLAWSRWTASCSILGWRDIAIQKFLNGTGEASGTGEN